MSLSHDPRLREIAKELCRKLRRNQTNAERIFWEAVRNRKFMRLKFYRQYPIFFDFSGQETFFIADFFCFERQSVVEINGKIHNYRKDHDELRTFIINAKGIDVIRFRNDEIEHNLNRVLERLKRIFEQKS
jgi:very-short-patch-repair endonuclease